MSENASEAGVQEISGFVLSEQFPEVARVFYFCSLEIIHKISHKYTNIESLSWRPSAYLSSCHSRRIENEPRELEIWCIFHYFGRSK